MHSAASDALTWLPFIMSPRSFHTQGLYDTTAPPSAQLQSLRSNHSSYPDLIVDTTTELRSS